MSGCRLGVVTSAYNGGRAGGPGSVVDTLMGNANVDKGGAGGAAQEEASVEVGPGVGAAALTNAWSS